jgi:hypothetical protein
VIALTAIATCSACGVLAEGTMAEADKAAEAHTRKAGHPTATMARCMKARRSSRVACGCYVTVGQLITKQPGTGWRCVRCALAPDDAAAAAVNAIAANLGVTEITTERTP